MLVAMLKDIVALLSWLWLLTIYEYLFVSPANAWQTLNWQVGVINSTPSARRGDDFRSLAELQFQVAAISPPV